jgi:hypothetical protein
VQTVDKHIEENIMPSLYGTTVAANYGRMTSQQTYGVGEKYTNFGTRQLQIIKVAVSGADMTTADGSTGTYTDSNSLFSLAIRSLQQFAEIYAVYPPVAGGFYAVVALDTGNSADAGEAKNPAPGAINTGYGQVEAALGAATGGTVTVTEKTLAIGATL